MKTKLLRKIGLSVSALALSGTMVLTGVLPNLVRSSDTVAAQPLEERAAIKDVTGLVENKLSDYFDPSVVQQLSDSVSPDREISVMVALDTETIMDGYDTLDSNTSMTVADFALSRQGKAIVSKVEKESKAMQTTLKRAGIEYELGVSYNTLMSGFEIVIKAGDFAKVQAAVGKSAGVFISKEYAPCETTVVENDVKIYEGTGIFDTRDLDYDGTGTLVAVLDTGLDYDHTAFDPSRFDVADEDLVLTRSGVADLLKNNAFAAESRTQGLTASDVYINKKVPYAYDYADSDPDVYPINSDHGTHVAGIMVGNDDTIRGASPNAQLAFMKVFSDSSGGAKQSWILAALEDCVLLNVDVINMSLGSSTSFAREADEDQQQWVYDRVKEAGINLIAAASNDGSAAQGTTQNGNLGLVSNPETGTVGAPSTYDSTLSVANISGVKTPYLLYNDTIVYFNEARDNAGYPRHFVDDVLGPDVSDSMMEYVIVPGVGRSSEYNGLDVKGKLALVARGQTNFEEKARIAQAKGAAGLVIYNNVPGEIVMTIGYADFPCISLNRDDGKLLLSAPEGSRYIRLNKSQEAGPFMETSSSWGPLPDLGIKPEITAHGGEILSSIPGNKYERFTGTSMAAPNQASLTTLIRQYVKDTFGIDNTTREGRVQIAELVYQLMMSTTDIALNKNGLPFAVRRQGAGLANVTKATTTPAYLRTYVREHYDSRYNRYVSEHVIQPADPSLINDKTKVELGDDPDKTGVYTFDFQIVNIGNSALTYDVSAIVMSEGVSVQPTEQGRYTVDEMGHLLEGAVTTVTNVQNGTYNGNTVTVPASSDPTIVTVQIVLSDSDKEYIETNFENGMYVEGFVQLTAKTEGAVNLSLPYLGFFGDWTQAPLMDLEIFETDADAQNDSLTDDEKLMADFDVSTRPIGGLYKDYISYLGTFAYLQDPYATTKVIADKDKIALSNQEGQYGGINSISSIWFGLLRNAKSMELTITEEATGEVIWTTSDYNRYKSFYNSGAHVSSAMDVDFFVKENDLKNNTKYIVKVVGYIDYGNGGVDENGNNINRRNTFEFPFYTDFESPVATGVEYTYEHDNDTNTNKLYADVSLYDNHYIMGYIAGVISNNEDYDPDKRDSYMFSTDTFARYVTAVNGPRNSTNVIRIDLTDHIDAIKNSHDGRSFMVQTMDYALNSAVYEFQIPDEVAEIYFEEMKVEQEGDEPAGVVLSPNETYRLVPTTVPAQDTVWYETLKYEVVNQQLREVEGFNENQVVSVVNGQLVGMHPGTATVVARNNSYDENNPGAYKGPEAELKVTVLAPGDTGYVRYDKPVVETFALKGYYTNKVYYISNSEDRSLGVDKSHNDDGERNYVTVGEASIYMFSLYPSESMTIVPEIKGYFSDDRYRVIYRSNNSNIVSIEEEVLEDGTIGGRVTALNIDEYGNHIDTEASTSIDIILQMKDENGEFKDTMYALSLLINIKEPYNTSGAYLMNYYGLGGTVVIPERLRLTTIYNFAFSNSEFVEKDLEAGDVIDKEDPYTMKQWFIGDDTIKRVVIPEGVETIEQYAFANLTALEEVILPSTLYKIQFGAFYGCTSLSSVKFGSWENGKVVEDKSKHNLLFINEKAFYQCESLAEFPFGSGNQGVIAIGTSAFEEAGLQTINLPAATKSISANAFRNNRKLSALTIGASSINVGANAFAGDERLAAVDINASVIPEGLFDGCSSLKTVRLGKDVDVIGQYAFRNTSVESFVVADGNDSFIARNGGMYLLDKENPNRLVLVASNLRKYNNTFTPDKDETGKADVITIVGAGAFSTSADVRTVNLPDAIEIEEYAFANCKSLQALNLGKEIEAIGEGAFRGATSLPGIPKLAKNATIGDYAFAETRLAKVNLDEGLTVGAYAFANNEALAEVTVGNNVKLGEHAFYGTYKLTKVTIGDEVQIGEYAFAAMTSADYVARPEIRSAILNMVDSINKSPYFSSYDLEMSKFEFEYFSGEAIDFGDYRENSEKGYTQLTLGLKPFISSIKDLTIGENVVIGDYAFQGAGSGSYMKGSFNFITPTPDSDVTWFKSAGEELKSITLGKGASIGAYAFYGARYLTTINGAGLAGAVSIGDYAFAGSMDEEIVYVSSEATQYIKTLNTAPQLKDVDLSSAKIVGVGAFQGNEAVSSVKLGNVGIGYIDLEAEDIVVVTTENALADDVFSGSIALTSIDLSNLDVIGNGAFKNTKLTAVTLKEGAQVGDYAFSGIVNQTRFSSECNSTLKSVENLDKASSIGKYAFAGTLLEEADVSEAVKIGDFAFAYSKVTKVTLGEKLEKIGENPFAGCAIPEFTNDKGATTYDIGSNIKVIDGVLYRNVAKGMELITYPQGKKVAAFEIADKTVRIGAQAFLNADIPAVTINREVRAIGDKAFYGCTTLSVVNFRSLEAPILEEQYDYNYDEGQDFDLGIGIAVRDSIGKVIVNYTDGAKEFGTRYSKYDMWSSYATSVLFGANFVAGITEGRWTDDNMTKFERTLDQHTLIMVRPSNGTGYDNFTYSAYFDATIVGRAAITDAAVKLMSDIIELANRKLTADDYDMVYALKAVYDSLGIEDQAYLNSETYNGTTYYQILMNAVNVVTSLHESNTDGEEPPVEEKGSNLTWLWIVLGVVGGCAVVAAVALVILNRNKSGEKPETAETETEKSEEEKSE